MTMREHYEEIERNAWGTVNNVFSEAGYEELVDNARCNRHCQCINCGACIEGCQGVTCSEECSRQMDFVDPDWHETWG